MTKTAADTEEIRADEADTISEWFGLRARVHSEMGQSLEAEYAKKCSAMLRGRAKSIRRKAGLG